MSKHTPGPWMACGNGECWCGYVFGDGDVVVAKAIGPSDVEDLRPTRNEQKANARLIAAAPDLLTAAEAALAVLKFDTPDVWRDRVLAFVQTAKAQEAYEQLRAAIAKARGEG